ncbi:amidohydrolase family protein (plasmid) [Coraliomargarita sp. W4R53]
MAALTDSHLHLWGEQVAQARWLARPDRAHLRRAFTVANFLASRGSCPVDTVIAVAAGESLADSMNVLREAGASNGVVGAVIAWVDIRLPVSPQLAQLDEVDQSATLVGIRYPLIADPATLHRPAVVTQLRELGRLGLVFDLLIDHTDISSAILCVRACDSTTFVLDHLGRPPMAPEEQEVWRRNLALLAKEPNVKAKISGLTSEHRTLASLQSVVDTAVETFGPARLMLGSDWPISTLTASYAETMEAYSRSIDTLSLDERCSIKQTTAAATYGQRKSDEK